MKKKSLFMPRICKPYIILPIITLFCLAGFIGSYLFPNTVLDTYVINMSEAEGDSELLLPLSTGQVITYEMDTSGRSMQGIQVGINKRGQALAGIQLIYSVYASDECVSENRYDLAQGDDLQYVYLPFADSEKCSGKLRIEFALDTEVIELNAPALMANHSKIDNTATLVAVSEPLNETDEPGVDRAPSLKCSHIYSHDTYPFLYDFRLLTFVFLAASMAVCYPKRKKKKGEMNEE